MIQFHILLQVLGSTLWYKDSGGWCHVKSEDVARLETEWYQPQQSHGFLVFDTNTLTLFQPLLGAIFPSLAFTVLKASGP